MCRHSRWGKQTEIFCEGSLYCSVIKTLKEKFCAKGGVLTPPLVLFGHTAQFFLSMISSYVVCRFQDQ
jgi:hypothetical protein